MDHLLSVNQVACLLDLVEHGAHVVVPLIERLIRAFLACPGSTLLEHDDSLHSIYLGRNTSLLDDHVAEFALGKLHRDTGKLCESWELYAGIVALDGADVVLDQLSQELLQVQRGMLGLAFDERFENAHLGLNLWGLKG